MAENIKRKEYLEVVNQNNFFFFHNGRAVKNLKDLCTALVEIDQTTFEFHVNKEKNDIYNWIFEVICDEYLAESIKKIHSKEEMAKIISDRVKELERL